MIRRVALGVVLAALAFGGSAEAADLPSLQMTDYNPSQDSPTVPKKVVVNTAHEEIKLTMVLDSLVANADGEKLEDSASMEGELIVEQPTYVALPQMLIELTGHIVKTPNTWARLDVTIGSVKRSFSWKGDDVQSGTFKFNILESIPGGKVPPAFPVSALAFATRTKEGGAVMVSLDKIQVKLGNFQVAQAK